MNYFANTVTQLNVGQLNITEKLKVQKYFPNISIAYIFKMKLEF